MPTDARSFGEGTKLECGSLRERFAIEIGKPDAVEARIFLGGDPTHWEVASWPMWPAIVRARQSNRRVTLVLDSNTLPRPPREVGHALASRAELLTVDLQAASAPALRGGASWLCFEVATASKTRRWAVSSATALMLNESFGQLAEREAVRVRRVDRRVHERRELQRLHLRHRVTPASIREERTHHRLDRLELEAFLVGQGLPIPRHQSDDLMPENQYDALIAQCRKTLLADRAIASAVGQT